MGNPVTELNIENFGGVITLKKSVELFGKNGQQVFDVLALAGGYGTFHGLEAENATLAVANDKDLKKTLNEALKSLDIK